MLTYHIIIDLEMNPTSDILRTQCRGLKTETIEMGAVKVDASNNQIVDTFSCTVCPQFNYRIEPQITRLTGITTREVQFGKSFAEALTALTNWIGTDNARLYSWSNTDLSQIQKECKAKCLAFPLELTDWVDFQAEYPKYLGYSEKRCLSLKDAANLIGTPMASRKAHRALYDAQITARLVLFALTGEYRAYAQNISKSFCSRNTPLSCSIGDACNGKLAALLDRLKKEEYEKEVTTYGSMLIGTTPNLVR